MATEIYSFLAFSCDHIVKGSLIYEQCSEVLLN